LFRYYLKPPRKTWVRLLNKVCTFIAPFLLLFCGTDLPDLMKGSKDSDSGENGDVPTNNGDKEDEDMDLGGGAAAVR
jgi:hypothetical protein